MNIKHIIFYSGGIGSWGTAKRVIAKHGKENVILMFTDTKMEDEDLYRFLYETVREIYEFEDTDLTYLASEMKTRRDINLLMKLMNEAYENFHYVADGRDVWELFKDVRFIGNSRIAPCSRVLKQETAKEWIEENFSPEECVLHLGIDWTEDHRCNAPRENWLPYRVEFPMCEEPYLSKEDLLVELELLGIKRPKLYELGFSHNNCGGFCVRAGQGHFANLLKQKPELYKYHEDKEQEMRDFLHKDVSILKRTVKGERQNLTLKELRVDLVASGKVDWDDIGGCGCFVDSDYE